MFRQLFYVSLATSERGEALDPIYEASRHNNAIDGVTGLLLSDGRRFVQVLEGPSASVRETFRRIMLDPRHRDVEVVRDGEVAEREFGTWSMADRRRGARAAAIDARLRQLLRWASPELRAAFIDLLAPA